MYFWLVGWSTHLPPTPRGHFLAQSFELATFMAAHRLDFASTDPSPAAWPCATGRTQPAPSQASTCAERPGPAGPLGRGAGRPGRCRWGVAVVPAVVKGIRFVFSFFEIVLVRFDDWTC